MITQLINFPPIKAELDVLRGRGSSQEQIADVRYLPLAIARCSNPAVVQSDCRATQADYARVLNGRGDGSTVWANLSASRIEIFRPLAAASAVLVGLSSFIPVVLQGARAALVRSEHPCPSGFDLGELLEDDHSLGLGKAGDCSTLGLNAQARASLPLCGNPIIRDCGRHVAVPKWCANCKPPFCSLLNRRRKPSSFKAIVGNRKLQRASCTILDHRSRNFCEAEPFSI